MEIVKQGKEMHKLHEKSIQKLEFLRQILLLTTPIPHTDKTLFPGIASSFVRAMNMGWTAEFNSEILFTKLNFVSVFLRLPNLIGFCLL